MNRNKIALIAAAVFTVLTPNAYAALNIYSNSVEAAEDAKNAGNYEFKQRGLSSEETEVISAFGKDMPLSLSLQIIVPEDWKVDLNKAAINTPVNWVGKSTWPYILEQLAKDYNLLVSVDWEKRVVNVFSKDAEQVMIAKKEKEMQVTEAEKIALVKQTEEISKKAEKVREDLALEKIKLAKEEQKLAKARKYAAYEQDVLTQWQKDNPGKTTTISKLYNNANVFPLNNTEEAFIKMTANGTLKEFHEAIYVLRPETMLSANLVDWAKANGWTLVWKADNDFKITDKITMQGTLLNNLEHVMNLYRHSKKPLMVGYHTKNKVILVEDFNYDVK